MPRRPYRPDRLAWQMFLGSQAIDEGLLTPHQLRSRAWLRLRDDVYADARFDRTHGLACRAAAMRLPDQAVIAGASAAYLYGVEHAARFQDDVDVILPWQARVPRLRGLRVHTLDLDPDEVADHAGFRVTAPCRTCWDLASWTDAAGAVATIDTLLAKHLLSREQLADYLVARRGQRGSRRAEQVFGMVEAAAQSPQESRLRVRFTLAGLPRPVVQFEIRLPDGQVYHPDLAWPDFQVAVEYDGVWHGDTEQFHRDRRRLNQLVSAGWLVLHVTSERLRTDFPGIIREVRAALASRGCPLPPEAWHPRPVPQLH
jgi:hypothetical protein